MLDVDPVLEGTSQCSDGTLVSIACLTLAISLQIEAKMIFCRLLQTFEVSLPSDYKICVVQRATVKPDGNVVCTLRLRK